MSIRNRPLSIRNRPLSIRNRPLSVNNRSLSVVEGSEVGNVIKNQHPWIFRNNFNNAPNLPKLKNGNWVYFLDETGKHLGIGIYSHIGLIAVRMIYFGDNFSLGFFKNLIKKKLSSRLPLLRETNSLRLIHGENDSIPGITIDFHNDVLVFSIYSKSLYPMARYIGFVVYNFLTLHWNLDVSCILLKKPNRTEDQFLENSDYRVIRGKIHTQVEINFKKITYTINTLSQKGGIYNDIRNLRRYILENSEVFKNRNVLNLFSNNGLLSKCLEVAGAKSIVSVEDSVSALNIHKLNTPNSEKQKIIKGNIFKNIEALLEEINQVFDVVIIDPPSLTSSSKDKRKAKLIYQKLMESCLNVMSNPGILVMCSCSNRIHSNQFENIAQEVFKFKKVEYKKPIKLLNEIDHPVIDTFPEGDYFKVHIYTTGQ
ncbi:MAG: class I SAM-dependent rRNA methyltransferase [Leptospiraceae bacterium]|nr:class I SAM-dependent rRNA methyltransferase [Leptospiraceae bacterium]